VRSPEVGRVAAAEELVLDVVADGFASIENQVRSAVSLPLRHRPPEYNLTIAKWIPHPEFPELWKKVQSVPLSEKPLQFHLHLYRWSEVNGAWEGTEE